MSTLRKAVAGALTFAHLGGRNFKAAKADEDNTDDDQEKKGGNADEGDESDKKGRRAQRADESDDEEDENETRDGNGKGAKGAKADDEDADDDQDDDEDEMRGKGAVAAARSRERARCAAIMGSKHAARNVVLAANLAFNTTMTRNQAIAVLQGTPAAAAPHQNRSARNPSLGAGGEQTTNSKSAIAASWERSMNKVAPSRKR